MKKYFATVTILQNNEIRKGNQFFETKEEMIKTMKSAREFALEVNMYECQNIKEVGFEE